MGTNGDISTGVGELHSLDQEVVDILARNRSDQERAFDAAFRNKRVHAFVGECRIVDTLEDDIGLTEDEWDLVVDEHLSYLKEIHEDPTIEYTGIMKRGQARQWLEILRDEEDMSRTWKEEWDENENAWVRTYTFPSSEAGKVEIIEENDPRYFVAS